MGTKVPPDSGPLSVRAFVLRFVGVFLVFEALVYGLLWREAWFEPYARWNAQGAAWLLRPLLEGVRADGGLLSSTGFTIRVRPGCDAYQASAVLLAGVVAFPASLKRRLMGAGLGLASLLALNLVRLAALQWTGVHHPDHFESMHLAWLPALYVTAALTLLFAWALWARGRA
jgi:exosortase H (IPTLxxWG-CTERM-specific)